MFLSWLLNVNIFPFFKPWCKPTAFLILKFSRRDCLICRIICQDFLNSLLQVPRKTFSGFLNFQNYYGSRHHMSFWRGNRLHSYVNFHGLWFFIVPIMFKTEHKFDTKIEGIQFPPKKRWGVQEKNTFVSKIYVADKCVVNFLI